MQSETRLVPFFLLSFLPLVVLTIAQAVVNEGGGGAEQCTNTVSLSPAVTEYNATSTSVLQLYCVASNPPLDLSAYFWQKNGVDLNYPANKYVIGGFAAGDGGVYRCGVQSCYSNAIIINTAPTITLPPSDLTLYEGQSLQLACTADGWPTPIISVRKVSRPVLESSFAVYPKWTKDGSVVLPPGFTGLFTYTKLSAIITDGGTYTCTAMNALGSVTAVAYVSVLALPITSSSTTFSPSSLNGLDVSSSGQPASVATTTSSPPQPLQTTTSSANTYISSTPTLFSTSVHISISPSSSRAQATTVSITTTTGSTSPVVQVGGTFAEPYAGASFILAVAAALFAALLISTIVALSACVYFGRKIRQQRRNRAAAVDKTKLVADMEGGALETGKEHVDGSASQVDDSMPTTFGDFNNAKDQPEEHKEKVNSDSGELDLTSTEEAQLIKSSKKKSAAKAQNLGVGVAQHSEAQKPTKTTQQRAGPSEVRKSTKTTEQRSPDKGGPSEVRRSTKTTEQRGAGPSEVRRSTKTTEQRGAERAGPSEVRKSTKTTEQRGAGPSEVRRSTKTTTEQRGTDRAGPSEVRRSTKTNEQISSPEKVGPSEVRRSTKTTEQRAGPSEVRSSTKTTEQSSPEKAAPSEVTRSTKTGAEKAGPSEVQRPHKAIEQSGTQKAGEPSDVRRPSKTIEKRSSESDVALVVSFEDPSVDDVPQVTSPTTAEVAPKVTGRARKLKLNIANSDKTTLIGAGDSDEGGEEAGGLELSVNEGDAGIAGMSIFVEKAKKMGRSVAYLKKISRSHAMNVAEIDGLLQMTDQAVANNKESENPIISEFKSIPDNMFKDQQLPPSALAKNRYGNILPNPYSAVVLTSSGQEGSTYINANYVRGLNGSPDKSFIMTQGPIPETFADFWRMVWENNVPSIVMLTKLVENNKEKCARYWPEASSVDPIAYGQYTIRNNFEQVEAAYTISYLTITTEQKGIVRERDVVHLWYTAWPDFGVPKECGTILEFHDTVNAYLNPNEGPTIVHCSAGIGRSGAFIAIHMGIEEFKQMKIVDPLKYLCNIRQDRGGAIQTWEQYFYVHKVLAECMYMNGS